MSRKVKIVTNNINQLKSLPDVGINANQKALGSKFTFPLFVVIIREKIGEVRKPGMVLVRDKFNFYK